MVHSDDESMHIDTVIIWLWRISICALGLLFFRELAITVARDTPLFVDRRLEGFWDEVEAYHLRPETRKPANEVVERYGSGPVLRYMVNVDTGVTYLPSEHAARTVAIAQHVRSFKAQREAPFSIPGGILFGLTVIYVPIVLTARLAQRAITKMLCRHGGALDARTEYFTTIRRSRFWAPVIGFISTFALSFINAVIQMTPAIESTGMTVSQLAWVLLGLAYFSGLWMLLLSYIVDSILLAAAINPHRSLWDDIIAFSLMAPVLLFVYQNSWITTLTNAAAGLGAGLLHKLLPFRTMLASRSRGTQSAMLEDLDRSH